MDNQRLEAYDWSTQTAQLAEIGEEWRCCTMGHGVQFVTTIGPMMMPELLAGMNIFKLVFASESQQQLTCYRMCIPANSGCLAFLV